ncbi:COG1 (predicted), partial [Pycnogonum litorale]
FFFGCCAGVIHSSHVYIFDMKNETSLKTDMKTSVMGTEALFENYTIEEIQEIEKKTKMEIEKKKEELRLMVGERYRDLIEAADTIQAMKSSAVCITKCINDIVSQCKSLPDKKSLNFQPKESAVEKHVLYEVGAQIKLLLDIPKEIWSYIDRQNYLAATQLYLLARHIHTSLTMLPSTSISVLKSFPIINRQWSTISHFRSSILQGCHEVLKEASLDEQKMADNLISLMLLEDTTPRQVFNQFLLSRTKAMQDIFSADKEGVGAKTQICDVIKLILDTVYLVHALFYKSNDADDVIVNNLLFQTFEKISSNKSNGPLSLILLDSPAMKYLPRTVIDFRPVSMSAMVHVTDDHIETNCHDWIDTVISDVSKGFTRLLGYVNSVSGLSSIRNSIWSLLADDNHKNIWDVICQRILKRSLNLWEEFMHFAFTARVKALIKSHLNCAFDNVIEALNGSIHNITDSELTKFIWSDSSMDIISKGGWLNCGDKELADSGQLAMKARCYMPKIQRLCKVFDVRIKSCLDDFGHFVIAEKDFQAPNHLHQTKEPFDRFADNAMLYQFLQDETKVCIARLFTFIHEHLKVFNEDPSSDEIMHRYVLFGRFLSGLTELSPNLSTCLCYAHHVNHAKIKSRAFSRSDIKERQAWN